jgi:hypothetical protein
MVETGYPPLALDVEERVLQTQKLERFGGHFDDQC